MHDLEMAENIDNMLREAETERVRGEATDLGNMFGAFYDALRDSKMPEDTAKQLTAMYGIHIFNSASRE